MPSVASIIWSLSLQNKSLLIITFCLFLSVSIFLNYLIQLDFFNIRCEMLGLVVVQSLSHVWPFAIPWTAARQASLSFIISWSLLKFISIESVMPPNHLILCHPLLLLPSIFPSIRVFSDESALCIRWPKYWSFSFIISPSNEYSWLISFRIDWFHLLRGYIIFFSKWSFWQNYLLKNCFLHNSTPKVCLPQSVHFKES